MLTPESASAPPESAASGCCAPPRVTTATRWPAGGRNIQMWPSSWYLLRSGSISRILHDRQIVSIRMRPVAVNPASLPAPSGYSHGTLVGTTLHLGGQTATDADMKIVPGGIVEQFRQAFGNVL